MKSITINGSQRESVGKVATKALRNAGQVPCVLYGGDKPLHFSATELSFKDLVYTPNAHTVVITLDNGETYNAILQDIQFHPVSDKILHIDFYQLFDDKPVTMEVPVTLTGRSIGVMRGGRLRVNMRKLKVRAIPANLPDFVEIDITDLKIGGKAYVRDLRSGDYTIMHPDNVVAVQVRRSRVSVDVEEDEEDAAAEGGEATAEASGEAAAE